MTSPQQPYGSGDPNQQSPYGSQPQEPYASSGSPYPGQAGQPAPYPPPVGYQPYPVVDQYGRPLSDKSKLTAGLLGIFLGSFGVGRFYLGYTTIGVLQLVVSIVTCGIGGLWGLIDGIIIIAGNVPDAEGRTLRD